MLLAAKALIQHNVKLSEHVLKTEAFAEEAAVKALYMDLEIHELSQKLADCRKENNNG